MFKVISTPVQTPNPDSLTLEMLEAKMKGLQALVATLAENTVNTQEAVLAARVEAQEKQIEGLTQWKEEALRAQLALRTQVSTLSTELVASRAELSTLTEKNTLLTDQVGHLEEKLKQTRAVIPKIEVFTGAGSGGVKDIPIPEGYSLDQCRFFSTKLTPVPVVSSIYNDRHTLKSRERTVYLTGLDTSKALNADASMSWGFIGVAVAHPYQDEDEPEAAASSAAASATG